MIGLITFGCSGGDDDSPGTDLALRDFSFEPAEFLATAGEQVTLTVTNEGEVAHNFSVPSLSVDLDLEPGREQNVIFVAPTEPGPLDFVCKFHEGQGMKGRFQVEA